MKKILVPTDFSENAYNALKYGIELMAEEECIFYLLHTYTPALFNAEFMVYSNLSLDEIYKVNVNKSLTQVVSRIKKDFPLSKHSFKRMACFNILQDEIKNQIKIKGIDLIIMGTQGATGAAQILLGTNTIHTIKGATCPVLAIPAHVEFYPPSNLLFATDFEPDVTEDHLKILKEIAITHKSTIHILHLLQDSLITPEQGKNREKLSKYLQGATHTFHITKSDTVTDGILNFQKEKYLDVLIMVKHKHSFFQNLFLRTVVDKVGFRVATPFLVIPVVNEN